MHNFFIPVQIDLAVGFDARQLIGALVLSVLVRPLLIVKRVAAELRLQIVTGLGDCCLSNKIRELELFHEPSDLVSFGDPRLTKFG